MAVFGWAIAPAIFTCAYYYHCRRLLHQRSKAANITFHRARMCIVRYLYYELWFYAVAVCRISNPYSLENTTISSICYTSARSVDILRILLWWRRRLNRPVSNATYSRLFVFAVLIVVNLVSYSVFLLFCSHRNRRMLHETMRCVETNYLSICLMQNQLFDAIEFNPKLVDFQFTELSRRINGSLEALLL